MSHVPHELAEEFPHLQDQMNDLKEKNGHFARLFDEYHVLNRAIHRAETNVEPTDDFNMTEMRKKRLSLKDEIASAIAAS